ncbi:S-layer homology domain-containing protein [Lysinibacillus telephonicus]|uniref:S-layer homology domain-containing protein n=1 Tax=Lysinibacillus telephonicus TaxID=1714840 RepID=UPI00397CB2CD
MVKKILGLLFSTILLISFVVPNISYANDISNHQMKTELTYFANKGVILPDEKGNYNPNRDVTRGEFAAYIARALELPNSSKYTFKDLKSGTRLTQEIQNAAAVNILSGYPDGTFKPNQKITRQQMAGMLYKALRYLDVPLNKAPLTFKDNYKISSSFTDAIANSVYYNIIRGDHTANGVYFKPKESATIAHAAAFIYRTLAVADKYGPQDEEDDDQPTQEPGDSNSSSYYIGKVSKGTITKNPTIYTTYEQALTAYNASSGDVNLILKGDKIVKMSSGLAYAADTTANTTSVYYNKNFTNQITYITEGRELKYNGTSSTGEYIIVQVGDIVGYAKPSDVNLVPASLIEGRDEYYVEDSLLTHRIYNHVKGAYEGKYTVGPAPSFMQSGATYYSFDGVHFYNSSDKLVGTYFPYFQFASVRKPSNYTAEELDNIIISELENREAFGGAQYKDATTKSKLIGLGSFLKEMEKAEHINALFVLATAIHESNYGMSANAQTKNNLFGIKVYDGDVQQGEKYTAPADSVKAFVVHYMQERYVPQSALYPFGAVPGNKTTGINVYYASDPHWGSKIAGHMYRIDSKYGKKDYGVGKIGMVLTGSGSVNTRLEPSTSSPLAYSYRQKNSGELEQLGYPVIIVDETQASDGTWYKVYSDDNKIAEYVWIRSDLVEVLD